MLLIEIKILLSNTNRIKIINALIKKHNFEVHIDFKFSNLTPGNFLIFNGMCKKNKININDEFSYNLELLLNLYKKNKDINLFNMILFIVDYYFNNLLKKKSYNTQKIIENKSFVINNLNRFITFNLNQNSLINAINNKLFNE